MALFSFSNYFPIFRNSFSSTEFSFRTDNFWKSFIVAILLIVVAGSISGATFTAAKSGNWNVGSTWNTTGYPQSGDNVNIGNYTITLTADAACTTFNSSSNWGINLGNYNLSISGNLTFGCTYGTITTTGGYLILNGTTQTINLCTGGGNSIPNLRLTNNTAVTFGPQQNLTITGSFDCQTGSCSITNNNYAGWGSGFLKMTGTCTAPNCTFIAGTNIVGTAFDFSSSTSNPIQVGSITDTQQNASINFGTKNVLTTTAFTVSNNNNITSSGTITVIPPKQFLSNVTSGDWNSTSTWQQSTDGGITWLAPATTIPTNVDGLVTIQPGHTITISNNHTASNLIVNGLLTITGNHTLTPNNATINGTVQVQGTAALVAGSGSITFNNGSTYNHFRDGGIIPIATWNAGSLLEVTGITTALVKLPQNIGGNVEWNCPSQNVSGDIYLDGSGTKSYTIGGNFTISSTNSKDISLFETTGKTLNIGGNYNQTSGNLITEATGTNDTQYINISGDFSLSGGTFNFSKSSGNTININVSGNWSHTGGTLTETSNSTGNIFFNGSTPQIYTSGGAVSNSVNFTVNSVATLQMADNTTSVSGGGDFTIQSGGSLGVTSSAGITTGTTASGNIQDTGTRTYSASANYIYNGTTSQITGNGLNQHTPADITINNTGNTVTLSANTNLSGALTVKAGSTLALTTFSLGATNAPASVVLEIGTTGSIISGTGTGILHLGGNVTLNNITGNNGAMITCPINLDGTRNFIVNDDGTSATDLTVSGIIDNGTGTNGIIKTGTGTMLLSGVNTYSGATTISAGELRINPIANITSNSQFILNGGTLSTVGITSGRIISNSSTLQLNVSTSLNLGSNNHSLKFANSNALSWIGTLTINGWSGTSGGGTNGKIFFGNSTSGLTPTQLVQISFTGYSNGAEILSTGEIVPTILSITPSSLDFGYLSSGSTSANLSYTITGTNLSGYPGNIAVAAPTGFEVSLSSGSGFGSSINVPYTSSTLNAKVFVHFKPQTATLFNSNITNTVTGATVKNVSVTGTAISPWSFWFKADGATTYNGTTWPDETPTHNNAIRSGGTITYADNTINFNPSLTFTSVFKQMQIQNSASVQSFVVVTLPNTTNHLAGLIGTSLDVGIRLGATSSPYDWIGDNNLNDWAKGGLSQINGVTGNQFTNWHIVNQTKSAPLNSQFYLGGYFNNNDSRQYSGSIAEIMAFPGSVTYQNAVESYLAIKYGLTLGHDYIAGFGGAKVYPISGYENDIAGLGYDVSYGLNQKVSTSVNIALGNGSRVIMATTNDFTAPNLTRTTSLTNGQYLIWGHNGGTTTAWNFAGIPSADNIVNRMWQVQNTNSVGTVYFQIDLTGYPALRGTTGTYALMLNSTTNFSSGTTLYKLTKSGSSGNLYVATGVTFPSGTSYFTIGQRNFWVGTSGSAWATGGNWSTGSIPTTKSNVEFATTTNNGAFPAVNNLVLDNNYTIGSLTNVSNLQLVIPPALSLSVNGSITTANASNIYIRSAQDLVNGSFIFPNATNVQATVEMYSKAHSIAAPGIQFPLSTGPYYRFSWQYFGVPVNSIPASPTFDGSYVRRLYEPGTTIQTHWVQLSNSSQLDPFYGYEITQDVTTGKLIVFQGQLINTDWTSPIQGRTAAVTGALFPGQFIFANPYTAAIDIQKFRTRLGSDTDGNVYLYSTGSLADWGTTGGKGFNNGTSAGQYQVVTSTTGTGIPTQIPSMQAVIIQMTTGNLPGSTVTFNYSDIVNNTELMRVKNSADFSSETMSYTMIDLNGSEYSDRMWIFTDSIFTHHYDKGWDGKKMLGIALAPQLYAVEQDGNYQVDCVDELNNTILGFQQGIDTEYKFTFTHHNIVNKCSGIYLLDLVENKTVDITQSGSTYPFLAESTPQTVNRFKIIAIPIKKNAADVTTQLKVFTSDNTVFIQNLSNLNGEIVVYDMMGQNLKTAKFGSLGITAIPFGNISGAYVVKAATGNEQVSKRIILGK